MPFHFNATLKSLDDVPEAFKGLYATVKHDDGEETFNLNAELATTLKSSKDALERERTRAKNAEKAVSAIRKQFGTDKPDEILAKQKDEIAELQARIDELSDTNDDDDSTDDGDKKKVALAGLNKKLDAQKKTLEASAKKEKEALAAQIKERDDKIARMHKSLDKHVRHNGALAAIAEQKGKVKALLPHVLPRLKMIENDKGDYELKVMDDDGEIARDFEKNADMTPVGLVASLKADTDLMAFFDVDPPAGSGSKGSQQRTGGSSSSDKVNPFDPKTFNLTRQMELIHTNRAEAERLCRAAGQKVDF